MTLESRLVEMLNEKLDKEDERTVDAMASGVIADWGQYKKLAGYRKAIVDFRLLIKESIDELMKD